MADESGIRVGVLGAGGRMGQAIIAEVTAAADLVLAGGVERPGHPRCGADLGDGMVVTANAKPVAYHADVLIDFTRPDALPENIEAALAARCALVVGTTGLQPRHHALLDEASRTIAVLQAPNMALGVNVLAALVEQAARALGDGYDIEIVEMHHRHKVDSPSGTALFLGEAAARGRGATLDALRLDPVRTGARRAGGIGFAVLRGGSVAGNHTVILAGEGERLELGHVAESRILFARGAVAAARFVARRKPGRYHMAEMLGFASPAA